MAHALCQDRLDVGSEGRTRVAWEGVVGGVGGGSLTDAEDVRPLLDVFPEVLRVQGGVTVQRDRSSV